VFPLTRSTSRSRFFGLPFSPSVLFAAGEQGVWYDPSDFSTLFQNAAGTTPVTAVEQPVRLMLDKSGRGNHATAPNDTARPVLRARYNLLLNTTTLATQSVTVVAAAHTLRFTGTGSITLSGTASGTYSAGSHSITPTAGSLTLTVSGTVTDADLRVTNDALNQPAYQRVGAASDYDTNGFLPFLVFDGSDDGMSTSAIDFSGTDKMTVVSGWRRLANGGIPLELSSAVGSNPGSFYVFSGDRSNATGAIWTVSSRGTATDSANQAVETAANYNAPLTNLVTGLFDISGDLTILRINGTQVGTATGDQGSGNFGSTYPLFIGARNNASLRFNGRLYSLIIRGAASSASEIDATEAWVNARTGAY
jgi:hypothetical protein